MPRDVPVGNDNYLVMFDRDYQIADLYYPHVGMENHVLGHPFKFGVLVDGSFSWTTKWKKQSIGYIEDTLATNVLLSNEEKSVEIVSNDCVDFVAPIFLRKVTVRNLSSRQRKLRLFFHHDFHIRGNAIGDTAYFDPRTGGLIHYKTDRYFLANVLTSAGDGVYQYACGVKESDGAIGTWKDAEDGELSGSPIAQGSVDSVLSTKLELGAASEGVLYYWIVAGKTYDEVQRRNEFVKVRSPQRLMKRTIDFWRLWVLKEPIPQTDLGEKIINLYKRSLLIAKSQTDGEGAVIAANDTDILQFNKDTYSYMWPRDGAFVTMALAESGYRVISGKFFEFCLGSILEGGWMFHKYQPDKSAGSSWHPWIVGGRKQLPIQEDETALVVISLWKHFEQFRDIDLIKPFYSPLAKKAGYFMTEYRDPSNGLPLDSYDLWEERRGRFTFTSSSVYAGLVCASKFARVFGEDEIEARFATAAEEVRRGILEYLFDPSVGRFLRSINVEDGKVVSKDSTIDSSLSGVFLFGVLPADDPRVEGTMKQVEEALTVKTTVGGLARYQRDRYQQLSDYTSNNNGIPGNPWFVTTLWMADWYTERARSRSELAPAKKIIEWAASHALPSGVMAEQLNPFDGSPVSVSPLTWSHAALVEAVNRYSRRFAALPQT